LQIRAWWWFAEAKTGGGAALAVCERIHYAPHAMSVSLFAALAASESSQFHRQYLTVAIFAVAAVAMVGAMLGLGRLLRPVHPQAQKYIAYESGVDPVGQGWSQSQVRYYVFALLFVMFDVEAVFIFPWATRLEAMGTYGLVEMGIFIGILVLGLVYAWRKGVLRWV
jgi:NADH-quinone oxidoreductase subunit A